MLVISNLPRASRSSDFEITRAITPFIVHWTKLRSFDWSRAVQLIPNCTRSVGVPIKFPWEWRNFVQCTINKKSHDLLIQFVNNRYSWFWKFSNCTRLKGFENFQNHSYLLITNCTRGSAISYTNFKITCTAHCKKSKNINDKLIGRLRT